LPLADAHAASCQELAFRAARYHDERKGFVVIIRHSRHSLALAYSVFALAFCNHALAASSGLLLVAPPAGIGAHSIPGGGGTTVTPVTPTVPPGPVPGRSTIIIPGVSGSGAATTRNPAAARPCGWGSHAAGNIRGNAGVATAPASNPNNTRTGVPIIFAPDRWDTRPTTNPSIRPGIPSSC
jgi:hypothetical protein